MVARAVCWVANKRLIVLGTVIVLGWPAGQICAASFDDDANQITSSDPAQRAQASKHLLNGGQDAVTALVRALEGKDRKTKAELVRAIVDMRRENKTFTPRDADVKDLARQVRMERDSAMRNFMLGAVRDLGGTAAVAELKTIGGGDSDAWIRRSATHYVANLSQNETAFLKKQTGDSDRSVRLAALLELAQMGDKGGRDMALQVLKSTASEGERHDAIWILGESGDNTDTNFLKQLAQSTNESATSRFLAIEAQKTIELLQLTTNGRLTFLMHALDDESPTIRNWAYIKLAKSSDPLTDTELKAYLMAPGHKGYKEAGDALNARKK